MYYFDWKEFYIDRAAIKPLCITDNIYYEQDSSKVLEDNFSKDSLNF